MSHSLPCSAVLLILSSRLYKPLPPLSIPPIIFQIPTLLLLMLFLQSFYIEPIFPFGTYQYPSWIAHFSILLHPNMICPNFLPNLLSLCSASIIWYSSVPPQLFPRSALLSPHFLLLLNSDLLRSYAPLCLCSDLHASWLGIDSVWDHQPVHIGSYLLSLSGIF